MKQSQTNAALIMTIYFVHDCAEMVRCSSVFRMSSIFAETSVSRTKKNLEGKLKSHVHTHLAVTTCSVVRDSTRFLCSVQHWALLLPRFCSPYVNAMPYIQFCILYFLPVYLFTYLPFFAKNLFLHYEKPVI